MSDLADGAPSIADLEALVDDLVGAWGCWAPALAPDGQRLAYVSDRRGKPELWTVSMDGTEPATVMELSEDPVLSVRWSPDGQWLACAVATGSGVRSEVWVLHPDGSDRRRLVGSPEHAVLGPWARRGHHLVVTLHDEHTAANRCVLIDPETGIEEPIASGGLVQVLDLSADERFALLRDGGRGAHFCLLLDRRSNTVHDVLPYAGTGSTDSGLIRPPPSADPAALVAYVVTDAGQARPELVAVPLGPDGVRSEVGALAHRGDAELEFIDADDGGRRLLLAWNVEGRSQLELLDTSSGTGRAVEDLPGSVVSGAVVSRDGRRAVVAVEGPASPSRLWVLDLDTRRWRPLAPTDEGDHRCDSPTLEHFESHDGLVITAWLYRPPTGTGGGPAVVSIHGGPESQERPVFKPEHQLLAAAGIVVLAPNIRGSSGFGRTFVHADDRFGRLDAIADVAACARWLVAQGLADPDRIGVTGRSYGGYVTLMALLDYPALFAAGVDVCGMSDLTTFFRDTEPWIAEAAVTKYGDPVQDAGLLASLSPLRRADRIRAPLLVVHGEVDTNVPVTEARQIVGALAGRGHQVEYLELAGEGHEYRRVSSRRLLLMTMVRFLSRALVLRPARRAENVR